MKQRSRATSHLYSMAAGSRATSKGGSATSIHCTNQKYERAAQVYPNRRSHVVCGPYTAEDGILCLDELRIEPNKGIIPTMKPGPCSLLGHPISPRELLLHRAFCPSVRNQRNHQLELGFRHHVDRPSIPPRRALFYRRRATGYSTQPPKTNHTETETRGPRHARGNRHVPPPIL